MELTPILTEIINTIVPCIITTIIFILYRSSRKYIENKRGKEALEIYDCIIGKVVGRINQTIVEDSKKGLDGKKYRLSHNTKTSIKRLATEQSINSMSEKIKKDISKIVNISRYTDNAIEAEVRKQKNGIK